MVQKCNLFFCLNLLPFCFNLNTNFLNSSRLIKMPLFRISTNLPKDAFGDDFLKEFSSVAQEIIGKPLQYIEVHVLPDQLMAFGGTTEPCAYVEVHSAGKISREENSKGTKKITEFMGAKGIPSDRMYVMFTDLPRSNVGYRGDVLAELPANK